VGGVLRFSGSSGGGEGLTSRASLTSTAGTETRNGLVLVAGTKPVASGRKVADVVLADSAECVSVDSTGFDCVAPLGPNLKPPSGTAGRLSSEVDVAAKTLFAVSCLATMAVITGATSGFFAS
jgi:hypothetical protein